MKLGTSASASGRRSSPTSPKKSYASSMVMTGWPSRLVSTPSAIRHLEIELVDRHRALRERDEVVPQHIGGDHAPIEHLRFDVGVTAVTGAPHRPREAVLVADGDTQRVARLRQP